MNFMLKKLIMENFKILQLNCYQNNCNKQVLQLETTRCLCLLILKLPSFLQSFTEVFFHKFHVFSVHSMPLLFLSVLSVHLSCQYPDPLQENAECLASVCCRNLVQCEGECVHPQSRMHELVITICGVPLHQLNFLLHRAMAFIAYVKKVALLIY